MAIKFPSDEWIKELSHQLNTSESYERAAKDWEGDFIVNHGKDHHLPTT